MTISFREVGYAGHTCLAKVTQALPMQVTTIIVSTGLSDSSKSQGILGIR